VIGDRKEGVFFSTYHLSLVTCHALVAAVVAATLSGCPAPARRFGPAAGDDDAPGRLLPG
jgi:hypothetical protein